MLLTRLIVRIIAACIVLVGLFFTLGITLYYVDVSKGIETFKMISFLHVPFYLLLVVSGVAIFRLKKWGIYLLYGLLIYDILYWFIPGFYQGLFKVILDSQRSELERVLTFFYLCYKRFLIPLLAYAFFSLPQIKKEFKEETIKGPFDK